MQRQIRIYCTWYDLNFQQTNPKLSDSVWQIKLWIKPLNLSKKKNAKVLAIIFIKEYI